MGQSSGEVIAITAVFTFLELFFVGLRLCARRITRGKGEGMGIDDVLASLAAVSNDVKDADSELSDCPQFLYIVCLAVPIIIRKDDCSSFLHVHRHRLNMTSKTESADANFGNHIQKTSSGKPMSTSYLFNLVSNQEFLTRY